MHLLLARCVHDAFVICRKHISLRNESMQPTVSSSYRNMLFEARLAAEHRMQVTIEPKEVNQALLRCFQRASANRVRK
jgi:hypothetical protein